MGGERRPVERQETTDRKQDTREIQPLAPSLLWALSNFIRDSLLSDAAAQRSHVVTRRIGIESLEAVISAI